MEYEEQKKVSLLLGLGIFFFPIIFAWFTLKKGYSTLAKAVSFAWLGLTLIAAFAMPNPEAETAPVAQPQPAQVESESVETSNNSVVADEAVEENTPTLTLQQKNAITYFNGDDEPKVKDAVWMSEKNLYLGVLNDGSDRSGYAQYACAVLIDDFGINKKGLMVKIVDIAEVAKNGKFKEIGKSYCE